MPMTRRRKSPRAHIGLGVVALLCVCVHASPAAAAIRVEVRGVDSTLRRNVLALLSVEHYKDRDRIEPDAVARLFRRVNDEVSDALKPYGYYAPTIQPKLTSEDNGRNWLVQIDIRLGEPVLLDTISVIVHGAGADDPVFARVTSARTLVKGRRLEHAAYEKVKSDLQLAAATYGYLDARLVRNQLAGGPHRASGRCLPGNREPANATTSVPRRWSSRDSRIATAPLSALPARRRLRCDQAAAHTVRAR